MTDDTLKLTDREVLDYTRESLEEHLPVHAEGDVCPRQEWLDARLGVATQRSTVESLCTDLLNLPDPPTIGQHLNAQLRPADLPELEPRMNAALADEIPRRVWRQARDVAIDFHDRRYYGTAPQATGLWVRGQATRGTTRFYRVATADVILNGRRVTLAIRFVLPEQDTVEVLGTLLKRLKTLGIRVARLFLDKGFAGTAVLRYLTRHHYAALIACPIRGKTGGTRALCRGRKSYCTPSTFTDAQGQPLTAELAVCRVFTTAKRTKRLKRRAAWLLFSLIGLDLSPRQARRLYRRRFGIETSYRCAGQVRGWTTSNTPAYRFILIALSFLLVNVWIHLRWLFTQVPRRGRRWLDTQRFRLARLVRFIIRALEGCYGYIQHIEAVAAPQP